MPVSRNSVKISAVTGVGIPSLLEAIARNMPEQTAEINVVLPFGPLAIFLHYVTGKHVRITLFFSTS